MDNEEYHAIDRVQTSSLKMLMRNPREYQACYVTGERAKPDLSEKRQVMIGDCVHQALLEKRDITELIVPYPVDCLGAGERLKPKQSKEFRESMKREGKIAVKDDEFKRIFSICNAVLRHELGLLIGRDDIVFETPVFWTDSLTGLDCKAKPDFMYEDDSSVTCYDLKVSESISPDGWGRIAKRLGYWLQDAHYSSGLAHTTGKPVRFVFWVVESVWPFRVARYEWDQISRERASEAYFRLLEELKRRTEKDDWKEDWESSSNMLTLDPWDVGAGEDGELEGFDE
jgi:exodeoxyribonuclease VIII